MTNVQEEAKEEEESDISHNPHAVNGNVELEEIARRAEAPATGVNGKDAHNPCTTM